MSETITAVYSNGVLHPQNRLSLKDGQTVRLQVLTDEPASSTEEIIQSLVAAGLVTPPPAWAMLSQFPKKPVGNWLKGWVNV